MRTNTRPLLFLALVAGLSVPFIALGGLRDGIGIGAMRLPASAVMVVLPGLVAAGLMWRDGGTTAVTALVRRVVDSPPARLRWYAITAGLFPLSSLLAALITSWATDAPSGLPLSLVAAPVLVAVFTLAAVCEELGWTAYATDPMIERFGVVGAGVALGMFWAVWHLIPLAQAGHSLGWMVGWFVNTVAARVVIVAVYNRSGGAVGTAVVAHAMINLSNAYSPALDSAAFMGSLAVLTTGAAVAVSLFPRHGLLCDSHGGLRRK